MHSIGWGVDGIQVARVIEQQTANVTTMDIKLEQDTYP